MLISLVFKTLIALHVENIKPDEFGVPERFYFPFPNSLFTDGSTEKHDEEICLTNNPNFEDDSVYKA